MSHSRLTQSMNEVAAIAAYCCKKLVRHHVVCHAPCYLIAMAHTASVVSCWQVVRLHSRHLLLPERYPRFTLLRQALGSARVGYEALTNAVPEVRNPSHLVFLLQQCKAEQTFLLLHTMAESACKSLQRKAPQNLYHTNIPLCHCYDDLIGTSNATARMPKLSNVWTA